VLYELLGLLGRPSRAHTLHTTLVDEPEEGQMAEERDQENEKTNGGVDLLRQLGDELRLHGWLAVAELRNPSLSGARGREQIDALARVRDELRVQLHLGKLEARDEFERIEGRWRRLMQLAERAVDDAEERIHDVLRDIRDAYRQMRSGEQ
jgi:hypothetical protein